MSCAAQVGPFLPLCVMGASVLLFPILSLKVALNSDTVFYSLNLQTLIPSRDGMGLDFVFSSSPWKEICFTLCWN